MSRIPFHVAGRVALALVPASILFLWLRFQPAVHRVASVPVRMIRTNAVEVGRDPADAAAVPRTSGRGDRKSVV